MRTRRFKPLSEEKNSIWNHLIQEKSHIELAILFETKGALASSPRLKWLMSLEFLNLHFLRSKTLPWCQLSSHGLSFAQPLVSQRICHWTKNSIRAGWKSSKKRAQNQWEARLTITNSIDNLSSGLNRSNAPSFNPTLVLLHYGCVAQKTSNQPVSKTLKARSIETWTHTWLTGVFAITKKIPCKS